MQGLKNCSSLPCTLSEVAMEGRAPWKGIPRMVGKQEPRMTAKEQARGPTVQAGDNLGVFDVPQHTERDLDER